MPELAYLNGKILPIEEATVPIEDRGYQFGDAVYEFIASYSGRMFRVNEHLARLQRSMDALEFPKVSLKEIEAGLSELFNQAGFDRAGIYIQISRGVAPRNHPFPADSKAQVVMTIRGLNEIPDEILEKGATVITLKDFRWGRCDIKTVQLLPNAMAKQKALDAGAYDCIFVTDRGIVREGTSSNAFIISGGVAVTHPLTPNILPGVTRSIIIDICARKDIAVEERFYSIDELYAADEVFLTGTTTEVMPIVRVDSYQIADGRVGQYAKLLYRALRQEAESG
jgi:D-alanine transaminase